MCIRDRANVDVPMLLIPELGTGALSVDWNWWYPSSAVSDYSGLIPHALNFYINSTTGENKSKMFFGYNDSSNLNTEFWANQTPALNGGVVDSTLNSSTAFPGLYQYGAEAFLKLLDEDTTIVFKQGDETQTEPPGFRHEQKYYY